MRLTITTGRRLAGAASFAAPILVLAIIRVLGIGPLAAHAEQADAGADGGPSSVSKPVKPIALEARLELPRASAAILARAGDLRTLSADSLRSPFYQPIAVEAEPAAQAAPVLPAAPTIPTFALSGIMNSRPPIAVIDGDVHRAGDNLGGGWSVESIDPRQLCVILRHTDGREHRLYSGS